MTAVFVMESDPDGQPTLLPASDDLERVSALTDPRATTEPWDPPVCSVYPSMGGGTDLPDLPNFATLVPCFGEKAVGVVGWMLAPNGRLWPLAEPHERFSAFHVTRVIDALDQQRSKFVRFPTGGILLITRHHFRDKVIRDETLFRLPDKKASAVYVTQRFVDVVEEAGLTGFVFHPVWDGHAPVEGERSGW